MSTKGPAGKRAVAPRGGAPRRSGEGREAQAVSPNKAAERRAPASSYEARRGQGSARLDEVRSAKRDRFVAGRQNKAKTWLFIGIPLVFFVLLGAAWYTSSGSSAGSDSGPAQPGAGLRRSAGAFTKVVPENGAVKLPVAEFEDGKARYYTYKTVANKEIDFFVLKSSDGVIRAAIDSCDVCFSFRKGYHQEGDEMVCNNCGQRFPSLKINVLKGGCNPAPLTRAVEGDDLIITEKDILADGDTYF